MDNNIANDNFDKGMVHAEPTKDFFISMLTRDLDLQDAIVELVDNSIDGIKRNGDEDYGKYRIKLTLSKDLFSIEDNCGGIPIDDAREYAFKFGKPSKYRKEVETTGVFGIGMKRSLFKIGKFFVVNSVAGDSDFLLKVDVPKWAENGEWNFPFDKYSDVGTVKHDCSELGTKIEVSNLYEGVANSMKSNIFVNSLIAKVRRRESYPISRGLKITINGFTIEHDEIAMICDSNMAPYKKTLFYKPNDTQVVTIRVVAGMTKRNNEGKWEPDKAGWYIYCNNREVVSADKTQLTTWYTEDGIKFHNKYAGFRGMVFFNSTNPELLPWNTSKNNVDSSADVFQFALSEIKNAFDKVKKEFDKLEDLEDEQKEKIVEKIQKMNSMPVNFYSSDSMPYSYVEKSIEKIVENDQKEPLVTVSYKVGKNALDKVKESLHATSAKEVGKETFKFYCMMEGIDNA